MSGPKAHHFFAQFHLKAWAEQSDGRIPTYQRIKDGTLKLIPFLPTETGCENQLYALEQVPPEERGKLETEFFSEHIDNNAAPAYQKIVANEQLTPHECAWWVRYLMAQRARTPDMVKRVKAQVDHGIRTFCQEYADKYEIARGNSDEELPESVLEWFDQAFPGKRQNLGLEILVDVIQNRKASEDISKMHWWVHDFSMSVVPLLASDRPLRMTGNVDGRGSYITLPLTPSKLFIASPTLERRGTFQQMNQLELVVRHNMMMAAYADRCVYGQTGMLFIQKHFGLGDKIVEHLRDFD